MAFAFNPDDGPARIFRYVDRGTLPDANLLAIYDKSQNLLIIDRGHFARLTDIEKRFVLRTHRPFIEIHYDAHDRPLTLAA
jgi:hypothetical protein